MLKSSGWRWMKVDTMNLNGWGWVQADASVWKWMKVDESGYNGWKLMKLSAVLHASLMPFLTEYVAVKSQFQNNLELFSTFSTLLQRIQYSFIFLKPLSRLKAPYLIRARRALGKTRPKAADYLVLKTAEDLDWNILPLHQLGFPCYVLLSQHFVSN